jgi:hypothetical protein
MALHVAHRNGTQRTTVELPSRAQPVTKVKNIRPVLSSRDENACQGRVEGLLEAAPRDTMDTMIAAITGEVTARV